MFKFENPIFFYAFVAVPVCIAIYIWYIYRAKKNMKKLGDLNLIYQLTPEVSKVKKTTKFILFLIHNFQLAVPGLAMRIYLTDQN